MVTNLVAIPRELFRGHTGQQVDVLVQHVNHQRHGSAARREGYQRLAYNAFVSGHTVLYFSALSPS